MLYSIYKNTDLSAAELSAYGKKYVAVVANATIITNLLDIGIEYAGTKRLFIEVNALTAVLVWGVAVWGYELFVIRFSIKNALITLAVVYTAFSQAAKTGLIGVIVCFIYIFFLTGIVKKKYIKQICLSVAGTVAAIYIYYYFVFSSGVDVFNRWQYFYSRLDVVTFLLSGRNELLESSLKIWLSDFVYVLFGISYAGGNSNAFRYVGAEMDIFDIFLYYGAIVGAGVLICLLRQFLKCIRGMWKRKSDNCYQFSFAILCIISFLGGHILNSPMAGLVFCISFVLTAVDKQKGVL